MKVFSQRYRSAIDNQNLSVELPIRLRGRLWKELEEVDETIRKTTDTGYNYDSCVLTEVEHEIKRLYGTDNFDVFLQKGSQGTSEKLKDLFYGGCYHDQLLDVIEVCFSELWNEKKIVFQQAINSAMEDEKASWRLSDGYFFMVDSEFLEQHILATTHLVLGDNGFKGAMDEFAEARSDLTGGDYKDAIFKACKSLESVVKTILTARDISFTPTSSASTLFGVLIDKAFFNDLPQDGQNAIRDIVLQSLPTLRNKLAGHGQGAEVVNISKEYASLAVNLAAVLNMFLVERHLLNFSPQATVKDASAEKWITSFVDEEFPF